MRKPLLKKADPAPSAETPGLAHAEREAQIACMAPASPRDLVPLIPDMMRRARRLTRTATDAEDLVQDTVVAICRRMRRNGDIIDLRAYAMRALAYRARQVWQRIETDELRDDDASTDPSAHLRLDCADALAAIERLPKPQRVLMRLVAAGETSPRRLAARTGLPVGTVMSRLARARARLRLTLGGSDKS